MTSYEKAKFRQTKELKDFRETIREKKLDSLTEEPLKPKFTLHHSDLNPEHYKDLSNTDMFDGFNSSFEHRIVHYLYTRYIRDPRIIARLEGIIKKMVEINKWKDIKDYK